MRAPASQDRRSAPRRRALLLALATSLSSGALAVPPAQSRAAAPSAAARSAAEPAAEDLLRAADAPRRPIEEGVIRIRATVEEPDKPPVVSDLDVYVQGSSRALCAFTGGPLSGRRILTVDDKVWLLVPGTTRPIPVSANQRLLGGASIADVARLSFAEEFSGTLRAETESVEGAPCRVVDLQARSRRSAYAGGTLWVSVADRLPRRARFTLRSGKEAKEVRYAAFTERGAHPVVKRMEIAHLLPGERGLATTLDFVAYEGRRLDPSLFDPAGVRAPLEARVP